jgi:hypothetical protein
MDGNVCVRSLLGGEALEEYPYEEYLVDRLECYCESGDRSLWGIISPCKLIMKSKTSFGRYWYQPGLMRPTGRNLNGETFWNKEVDRMMV